MSNAWRTRASDSDKHRHFLSAARAEYEIRSDGLCPRNSWHLRIEWSPRAQCMSHAGALASQNRFVGKRRKDAHKSDEIHKKGRRKQSEVESATCVSLRVCSLFAKKDVNVYTFHVA